jgi:hypothetical protein
MDGAAPGNSAPGRRESGGPASARAEILFEFNAFTQVRELRPGASAPPEAFG